MAGTKLYECIESFAGSEPDGAPFSVKRGQLFREGHPMMKGRSERFRLTDMTRPEIEQATAAPGEKRQA